MNLQEFIQKTVSEINQAIESLKSSEQRRIYVSSDKEVKSVLFDVAVTVEENVSAKGDGSIKVIGLKTGGEVLSENKNATVTRIKFGIYVDINSDDEKKDAHKQYLNECNKLIGTKDNVFD